MPVRMRRVRARTATRSSKKRRGAEQISREARSQHPRQPAPLGRQPETDVGVEDEAIFLDQAPDRQYGYSAAPELERQLLRRTAGLQYAGGQRGGRRWRGPATRGHGRWCGFQGVAPHDVAQAASAAKGWAARRSHWVSAERLGSRSAEYDKRSSEAAAP